MLAAGAASIELDLCEYVNCGLRALPDGLHKIVVRLEGVHASINVANLEELIDEGVEGSLRVALIGASVQEEHDLLLKHGSGDEAETF